MGYIHLLRGVCFCQNTSNCTLTSWGLHSTEKIPLSQMKKEVGKEHDCRLRVTWKGIHINAWLWERAGWAGSSSQANTLLLALPGPGLTLSLQRGSVHSTANHSDQGVLGLGGSAALSRHHHIPPNISSARRCSKTTSWGNQKSTLGQGFHRAGDTWPKPCNSAEKSYPGELAVRVSLSTDIVINPSMPLKTIKQCVPASWIPTASVLYMVLNLALPNPLASVIWGRLLPSYQKLRKPKGNLSYNINRKERKGCQTETNKTWPLLYVSFPTKKKKKSAINKSESSRYFKMKNE